MQIVFNIAENSNIELAKGEYELVQGECCVTELKFNFPAAIKGVAIGNYKKQIEFSECKEFGECVKFVDDIDGDIYELKEQCTAFNKLLVQLVLTYNNIKWKTIPVALEFHESLNAEGHAAIQAQLLSLAEIKEEWEAFVRANTLRMIYNAGSVPTADASSLGDTIFYLGANTDTAPLLKYGHYYRCNFANGVYEWTDLTQDANLAGVADGVREINKNQTLQFWLGTTEELENEVPQENVAYIAEDEDLREGILEVFPEVPKLASTVGALLAHGVSIEFATPASVAGDYASRSIIANSEEIAVGDTIYLNYGDHENEDTAKVTEVIGGSGGTTRFMIDIAPTGAFCASSGVVTVTVARANKAQKAAVLTPSTFYADGELYPSIYVPTAGVYLLFLEERTTGTDYLRGLVTDIITVGETEARGCLRVFEDYGADNNPQHGTNPITISQYNKDGRFKIYCNSKYNNFLSDTYFYYKLVKAVKIAEF